MKPQRIHNIIRDRAAATPGSVAVIAGNRRVTYCELYAGVSGLAGMLSGSGLEKGQRVCICMENCPEYIMANFAVQAAGGITVDINPQYSALEALKIIRDCGACMVITEDKFLRNIGEAVKAEGLIHTVITGCPDRQTKRADAAMLLPSSVRIHLLEEVIRSDSYDRLLPEVSGHDVAAIVYTSGSTGSPKGVMLTHDNFEANAEAIITYLKLSADDSIMVLLPFCYSYGKSLLNTHLIAGGTLVLEKSFMYPNVVLDKMVAEDVTGFAGVPSTYSILLNRSNIRSYQFPKLRYLTQAGGALSPQHAREMTALLPDKEFYIMYGQTEATARITYLDPAYLLCKAGSIGKAIPWVTVELIREDGSIAAVDEEGEIVVSGRNVMAGYWNNPSETAKALINGKLHTGDIAKTDEEGYLYLIGRRSDMIKSGAHRISPKEIEEVILEIPEVHEAAVLGIADEILGEAVKAFVVMNEGCDLTEKYVQKFCQTKLAAFKIPKEVDFVQELPKTASGKVRKHFLKPEKELV